MEEPTYQYDFEPLSVDEVIQYKTYQMKEQMKVLEDSNVFCFSVYKMDLDDEVIYDSENKYETLINLIKHALVVEKNQGNIKKNILLKEKIEQLEKNINNLQIENTKLIRKINGLQNEINNVFRIYR
jgi:uncharacterized protein YlxW (UPF0749 family)